MEGLVYGKNAVKEAIKGPRLVKEVWISEKLQQSEQNDLIKLARSDRISYHLVSPGNLDKLTGCQEHQGVALKASPYRYSDYETVTQAMKRSKPRPFFLMLDHLQDPQNFGAILRTADAVGVDGVIIPRRRAVGVTPVVLKASSGAAEHINIIQVPNLSRVIEAMQKNWVWVIGADTRSDYHYFEADFTGAVTLVVGSEGYGLSRLVRQKCDFIVDIPMSGKVNSLNVSVASALLMYEIYRSRWF